MSFGIWHNSVPIYNKDILTISNMDGIVKVYLKHLLENINLHKYLMIGWNSLFALFIRLLNLIIL